MKKEKGESKEQRLERWAGIIRQQAESGLTVREFCLRMGFHYSKYYDWKKKLELRGAARAEEGCNGEGNGATPSGPPATAPAPSGWAAVALAAGPADPEPAAGRAGLAVEIGKCRVLAGRGTDMGLFADVCAALAALC